MLMRTFINKLFSLTILKMHFSTSATSTGSGVNPMNAKLIDKLMSDGVVRSPEVEKVMKNIDRGDFSTDSAYYDGAQSIGNNATISAPHMHGYALELLKDHLKRAKRCLDVGSGSGYLTLAFAMMMHEPGAVSYGIEHIPNLVKTSIINIEKHHKDFLKSGNVVIKEGDGRKGLAEQAPYEVIHVGAAAAEMPKDLIDQLALGGRMVIPVGVARQDFLVVDKDFEGKITKTPLLGVMYIPLTSKEEQCGRWL